MLLAGRPKIAIYYEELIQKLYLFQVLLKTMNLRSELPSDQEIDSQLYHTIMERKRHHYGDALKA